MPIEKSAGAVVFWRSPEGKIEYLLLKRPEETWCLPKGMIEKKEGLETAARREVMEETGLKNLTLVGGFKETVRYFFKVKYDYQLKRGLKMGENILKFVTHFLIESQDKKVKISEEHLDFAWLDLDAALGRLKFKNDRDILKKADDFLLKHR